MKSYKMYNIQFMRDSIYSYKTYNNKKKETKSGYLLTIPLLPLNLVEGIIISRLHKEQWCGVVFASCFPHNLW